MPWTAPTGAKDPPWPASPARPGDQRRPTRVLFIASTPRSGSTLLSDSLAETGLVGEPKEYFEAAIVGRFRHRWGLPTLTHHGRAGVVRRRLRRQQVWWASYRYTENSMVEYRDRILSQFTSPTGWFALNMQAGSYQGFRDGPWDPLTWDVPVDWIHLARNDVLRQAISQVRARQTGRWTADAPPGGAPRYDADAIARSMASLVLHDRMWRELFAERGISPIEVTYEALAADHAAQVARVLSGLGMDGVAIPPPPTRRQADATTDAWVDRYLAEQSR